LRTDPRVVAQAFAAGWRGRVPSDPNPALFDSAEHRAYLAGDWLHDHHVELLAAWAIGTTLVAAGYVAGRLDGGRR
jgi:hypothetical protein